MRKLILIIFIGIISVGFAKGVISQKQVPEIPTIEGVLAPKELKLELVNNTNLFYGWPVDTLKNDNDTAYFYFRTAFFLSARLSPAAPCTLLSLMFAKYRGPYSDTSYPVVAGCSLVICKDTVIGGYHYPGRPLIVGYVRDSLPSGWYAAWFVYNIFPNDTFRLPAEDFWLGCRYVQIYPQDTLFLLGDNAASGPDRNAYGPYSSGPWFLYTGSDFMNRAIVKYEEVEVPDVSVLSIDNSQGFFLPNPGNATISANIKNTGSVAVNNFPVVCTVYTITGVPMANFVYQITQELAVNEERQISFTPNWQPTVDGKYIIVVRSKLPNDQRPQNDRATREAQVCTYPCELSYDDGERDNAWAWYRAGNGWAVKFVPPSYPVIIDSVSYCTWSDSWPQPGGTRMLARIYKDDGNQGFPGTILWQETVNVTRGTFTTFDVPDIRIDNGAFYVAYIQTDTWIYSPGLAIDEDPPYARQIYTYYNNQWYYEPDEYGGDFMIRVKLSSVAPPPPSAGWQKKADVAGAAKPVKSGGALVAVGDKVYGLVGNNTRDLMVYYINGDSWKKAGEVPLSYLTTKKKNVKKGAAICADKDGVIYVIKGNNTKEFWRYKSTPAGDSWKEWQVDFTKGIKGGSMAYDGDSFIYVISGSNNNEWRRFNIYTEAFEPCNPASLPADKWKTGSWIVYAGDAIYGLRVGGKTNEFYRIPIGGTAERKADMPLIGSTGRKKKAKEGSAGAYNPVDGKIYALKGGNTLEFFSYGPVAAGRDTWDILDDVGKGAPTGPAKRVKGGGALTYSASAQGLYAFIGSGTNEFWFYGPPTFLANTKPAGDIGIQAETKSLKNFTLTVNRVKDYLKVSYTLPVNTKATLKIYNALGEIVYTATSDKGYFVIDTKRFATGIYIMKFAANEYKATKKLVIH